MESSLEEERVMISEPLLKNSPKGGSKPLPFIIGNAMLEKVAICGLIPNMTLYLINEYHMEMTTASSLLFYWSAALNLTPVIGAIIADSYAGRFSMIGFGSILGLLGMNLLVLTAVIPELRPSPCNESVYDCSSATILQLFLLYTSFGVIAIGSGGVRSSSLAFGADQLYNGDRSMKEGFLERYYSWFYATHTFSVLIAYSAVVYIQDKMGWGFGFGVSAVLMVFSALLFFSGAPFYAKVKAKASLITELIQVIVASCKKRHIKSSSENINVIFHHKEGSALHFPTEKLIFLNKACIVQDAQQELTQDGVARDPWSLCTVDQVEDLKTVVKVIPIWSTGVVTFVNASQNSFSVLQATSVNRKITVNFEIPAGSFGTISVMSIILWVLLYDGVILPIVSRIRGKPTHFSTKQRMGAGIFLSCVCMMVTAAVEGIRRSIANKEGLSTVPMSALWLVPQNFLMGIAEGLNVIAQNEFYLSEFPKSMSSTASALCFVGASAANMLASFLMNTIDNLTKKGGQDSWVSSNINKAHYDYYFWVLSGLGILNFMYFLLCCRTYGPCRGEQENARRDEEDVLS